MMIKDIHLRLFVMIVYRAADHSQASGQDGQRSSCGIDG